MGKIFWGLLFLFIDINIGSICITPDFIGYILIFAGMKEYAEVATFAQTLPWTIAGAVLSAIFWLPIWGNGVLLTLADLAETIIWLYVTYRIVVGVEELEQLHAADLNSANLRKSWKVAAVCVIAALLLGWLGELFALLLLAAAVVGLVATVVYIVAFYQSKKALEY